MNDLSTADVQEIMDRLMGGDLPEHIRLVSQPNLAASQAFGVIYFLQEHTQIIPDNFEKCEVCDCIFDVDDEGFNDDIPLCSVECQARYTPAVNGTGAQGAKE